MIRVEVNYQTKVVSTITLTPAEEAAVLAAAAAEKVKADEKAAQESALAKVKSDFAKLDPKSASIEDIVKYLQAIKG